MYHMLRNELGVGLSLICMKFNTFRIISCIHPSLIQITYKVEETKNIT